MSPGSGTANASAIVSMRDRRLFLKRRNPRYADLEWVQFDHALMRHLTEAGLPVPQAITANSGRPWVTAQNGVYELFGYIEGAPHDYGNGDQLQQAAEALARWHHAANSFNPPTTKDWDRYHSPADSVSGLQQVLGESDTNMPKVQKASLQQALKLAKKLTEHLPASTYRSLPRTIVHGDYHPANLKFRGNDLAGIFDLDWATQQPRMVDLADGLLFFGAARDEPIVEGDIWSLTDSFTLKQQRVRQFAEAYSAIVPLQKRELETLADFMRCRWLYCRVDAAVRKVNRQRRAEFITRDLFDTLDEIDRMENQLSDTITVHDNPSTAR